MSRITVVMKRPAGDEQLMNAIAAPMWPNKSIFHASRLAAVSSSCENLDASSRWLMDAKNSSNERLCRKACEVATRRARPLQGHSPVLSMHSEVFTVLIAHCSHNPNHFLPIANFLGASGYVRWMSLPNPRKVTAR